MICCHRSFAKQTKGSKKRWKKNKKYMKRFNLWAIHQWLQIGCKLNWAKKHLTIKVDHNNVFFLIMIFF
jgi:hypothetical protein